LKELEEELLNAEGSVMYELVSSLEEKISNLASEHEALWKNATALERVVQRNDPEKEQLELNEISL
jgi:hypothetical protein